jgi:two-component system, NarL family, response regulator DesR
MNGIEVKGLAKSFHSGQSTVHAVREHDVLAAAVDHSTAAEIAATLHLSEGTVRNYRSSAIRKLGARNRREAVDLAVQKGWL